MSYSYNYFKEAVFLIDFPDKDWNYFEELKLNSNSNVDWAFLMLIKNYINHFDQKSILLHFWNKTKNNMTSYTYYKNINFRIETWVITQEKLFVALIKSCKELLSRSVKFVFVPIFYELLSCIWSPLRKLILWKIYIFSLYFIQKNKKGVGLCCREDYQRYVHVTEICELLFTLNEKIGYENAIKQSAVLQVLYNR